MFSNIFGKRQHHRPPVGQAVVPDIKKSAYYKTGLGKARLAQANSRRGLNRQPVPQVRTTYTIMCSCTQSIEVPLSFREAPTLYSCPHCNNQMVTVKCRCGEILDIPYNFDAISICDSCKTPNRPRFIPMPKDHALPAMYSKPPLPSCHECGTLKPRDHRGICEGCGVPFPPPF